MGYKEEPVEEHRKLLWIAYNPDARFYVVRRKGAVFDEQSTPQPAVY